MTSLTSKKLKAIVQILAVKPIELVQKKEKIWLKEYRNTTLSHGEIISTIILSPFLIERSIVSAANKALIVQLLEKLKTII